MIYLRTTLMAVASVLATSAFANSLFIENHSFEEPTLNSGQFFYSPTELPGWTSTATGGADRGIWNTTASGKDGSNIAFCYRNNSLAQQLSDTVQSFTTYKVTYLLGRTGNLTTGTVELYAGGTVADGLVSGGTLLESKSIELSQSAMTEYSFEVSTTNSGPIGENLAIRLAGPTSTGQSYVSFDNIRIDANPVPEPATLAALSLGVLATIRRKKIAKR